MMLEERMKGRSVIIFDAQCLLCSANARFVLKFDRRRRFLLASIQSEAGKALCRKFGVDPEAPETLLLIGNGQAVRESDAVIGIATGLGWPWRLFSAVRLVPRPLRDALYLWVARNRYRLFGRRETCWLPKPEHMERML